VQERGRYFMRAQREDVMKGKWKRPPFLQGRRTLFDPPLPATGRSVLDYHDDDALDRVER